MTKARPPLSTEQALLRIAGHIGYDGIKAAIGHEERVVRNMGDPDHSREITYDEAIKLDVAYRDAGGVGLPFFQCFEHRASLVAAEAMPDVIAIAEHAAIQAKEAGDATAAVFMAIRPGATKVDRAIAAKELRQEIQAAQDTLSLLDAGSGEDVYRPGGAS
ncbi:MAG: hypothetical protein JWQ16_1726 [Novosphingobium sp.]|nr:hypothetical protein [Novosphingobium sp.]